jgi:SAM-dependent methyltransferase
MGLTMDKPTQNIDVEEIMKRLRAKLGDNWSHNKAPLHYAGTSPLSEPKSPSGTKSPSSVNISTPDWNKINSTIVEAESRQYVWTTKPVVDHYHGVVKGLASIVGKVFLYFAQVVTKPQQAFNTSLMQLVNKIAESLQITHENIQRIQSRKDDFEAIEAKVSILKNEVEEIVNSLRVIPAIDDRTKLIQDRMNALESIQLQIQDLNMRFSAVPIFEKHLAYLESRLDILPQFERNLADVRTRIESVSTIEHSLTALQDRVGSISAIERSLTTLQDRIGSMPAIEHSLAELKGRVDLLSMIEHRIDELIHAKESFMAFESNIKGIVSELKPQVVHVQEHLARLMATTIGQERRLSVILDEARRRLPHSFDQEQLQILSQEFEAMDEEFYLAFENKYRGSRQEIKDRVRVYLPMIQKAGAGSRQQPILDVGCGRGEWLEVLKDEGMIGFGLDLSNTMVENCKALGLNAEQGDVLEYIKQIKDESLGAVTGFHIIEHLPYKVWMNVFDESLRALKPGGVMIFETPNPENVIVASSSFYLDPSHIHPLPPELVKFTAESRGFCDVEILPLHPVDAANFITDNSDMANRFNNYFYGPRDYAVIGWKA